MRIPRSSSELLAGLLLIFIVLSVAPLLNGCKRGEFSKLESPAVLVFIQPGETLDLLQDAKTSEKPFAQLTSRDTVEAVGLLRLAAATFLQVKCPERIRCEDGMAYVLKDHVASTSRETDEKTIAYLMDLNESLDGGLDRARQTGEWLANPDREIPVRPDIQMIEARLNRIKNPDDRLVRTLELLYVLSGINHPETVANRTSPLVTRYAVLRQIAAANSAEGEPPTPDAKIIVAEKERTQLLQVLQDRTEKELQKMLDGFPFRNPTWAGLAKEFNQLSDTVYLPARILAKLIETGEYVIEPSLPAKEAPTEKDEGTTQTVAWKVDIRPLDGVFLSGRMHTAGTTTSEETNETLRVLSIRAAPAKSGLALELKTEGETLKIRPRVVPAFLAKGGPGLKEIVDKIPGNWQTVLEENDFNHAAMLMALKFGKPDGETAYHDGKLNYIMDTQDWHYWMMFGLIKKSPHIKVEGNGFNGSFDARSGSALYEGGQAVEAWYQPPGEFKIQFRWIGGRGGDSPLSETTCFAKDAPGAFRVTFTPAEIHKEHPAVTLELLGPDDFPASLCKAVIAGLNDETPN